MGVRTWPWPCTHHGVGNCARFQNSCTSPSCYKQHRVTTPPQVRSAGATEGTSRSLQFLREARKGGSGSGTKRSQEARNSPRSKPRSSWGGSPASAMDSGVPSDLPLSLEWILPCTSLLGCGELKGLSPVMPQVVQEPSWWEPLGGASWPESMWPRLQVTRQSTG